MKKIQGLIGSLFKRHDWRRETIADMEHRTCSCHGRVDVRGMGVGAWVTVKQGGKGA